jgi:hypothetical protein
MKQHFKNLVPATLFAIALLGGCSNSPSLPATGIVWEGSCTTSSIRTARSLSLRTSASNSSRRLEVIASGTKLIIGWDPDGSTADRNGYTYVKSCASGKAGWVLVSGVSGIYRG